MTETHQRYVIDNATLSGVERLIGKSKVLNLNYLDHDILCFEKLITAILFSDEILAVDDYKDRYRASRLQNFDFVNFLKLGTDEYDRLSADAANFAHSMTFGFEGSQPAGDVLSFFDALRIDPQLRWDVFVSSEYLTLSYLIGGSSADSYERTIDAAFRHEQTDAKSVSSDPQTGASFFVEGRSDIRAVKELVATLAKDNPNFRGEDGKSALQRIVFGYGWMAERSRLYNDVAANNRAIASLSPLRDAFCESCLRIDYPAQIPSLIEGLKKSSQKTLAAILEPSGQTKFALKTPFFASYLISKVDRPSKCIELALELRRKAEFQDCRTIFHNLHIESHAQTTASMNRILRYLEQSLGKMMEEYSVSTPQGIPVSFSVGMAGVSLGTNLKTEALFRSYKDRPFASVFRSISQDMLNVERLGALHDRLRSEIIQHPDAHSPKISSTPRYMRNRESQYGRPANVE